ncbi:hypothetical protein [Flavobacterium restrictum]|uniref:XRE family transcriptional regulator n=1 Tax=Flavobacterium restrictum TaxID=2594428 RepID=A0A553EB54_9FLAO|nr:hypothetical protein [Flavobacterium restrictum]TRX42161.1 hypothetical protein FNW21_02515 [Flavobacterium restrictum]
MQSKPTNSPVDLHVGTMLKTYIDHHRISKASLARYLGIQDSVVLRYQKSATLQAALLLRLSHALKHNFFQDIASTLPSTYTTTAPLDTTKDVKIAALEQEIIILKAEKAVLLLR